MIKEIFLSKTYFSENKIHIKFGDHWGNRKIKINAIIGNNGAGKSSILRYIHAFFGDKNGSVNDLLNKGDYIITEEYGIKKVEEDIEKIGITGRFITKKFNNFKKYFHIIVDDIYNFSNLKYNSVNKEDFTGDGVIGNKLSCKIYNILQERKNEKIIKSIVNFLFKEYELLCGYEIGGGEKRYRRYGGEHIYFLEKSTTKTEDIESFINKNINRSQVFQLFGMLFKTDKHKTLDNIFSKKECSAIILSLSDLFIANINEWRSGGDLEFDKGINYTINSDYKDFTKQRGYRQFKQSLLWCKEFLDIIEDNDSIIHIKDWQKKEGKDNEEAYSVFIKQSEFNKYWQDLKENLDMFLIILNNIEKGNIADAQKTAKSFGLQHGGEPLFHILRRTSSYERTYVGGSEYFLAELIFGFQDTQDTEYENKVLWTFQRFFYYRVRNEFYSQLEKNGVKIKGGEILSEEEINILSFPFFNIIGKFTKGKKTKKISEFSAGETIYLLRTVNVYNEILLKSKKGIKNFIILTDEPELHFHMERQRHYIKNLIRFLESIVNIGKEITIHNIIATHSPFILSDLPQENIIFLNKENDNIQINNTKITETFGASYIDLLKNNFFLTNTMGEYAKEYIEKIAKKEKLLYIYESNINNIITDENKKIIEEELGIRRDLNTNEKIKYISKIKKDLEKEKELIGDPFLKNNLIYL